MLKAVIANDKKKANLMLRELLNWNALGIEIVGMAEDTEEALELIISTVPDIVVVSAKLRGMYGPELVQAALEHGVRPAYIVVQGTRSFESVYAALKCGVDDYLVGQINTAELAAALKKVCDRRLQEEVQEETERKERRMFETNKGLIRKHFMSNYINGNIADPIHTINRLNGDFLFDFRPGIFETILVRPDFKPGTDIHRAEIVRVMDELGAIVEEQLGKRCNELVWFHQKGELLCVLNYSGSIQKEMEILIERLKKRIHDRLDGSSTLARGTREREVTGIINSTLMARNALESRIVLGIDRILDVQEIDDLSRDTSELLTPEREGRLRNCVEALNSKGFGVEVDNLYGELAARPDLAPTVYYALARRIGEIVLEQLRDAGTRVGNPSAQLDEYYSRVADCYLPGMLRNLTTRWGVGMLERMLYEKDGRESRSIRLAKAYIREHYREAVKLSDVAGQVHLNPSYFSTLFKKELGVNFNDFLIECRLNSAKEMLRTTTLSISKIAEQIGYSDAKYFSKLFVKHVGVKPSEYRRIYS